MTRKIIVYATTNNGNGYSTMIGEYDDIEDIQLRISMFAPDVVVTLEEKIIEE